MSDPNMKPEQSHPESTEVIFSEGTVFENESIQTIELNKDEIPLMRKVTVPTEYAISSTALDPPSKNKTLRQIADALFQSQVKMLVLSIVLLMIILAILIGNKYYMGTSFKDDLLIVVFVLIGVLAILFAILPCLGYVIKRAGSTKVMVAFEVVHYLKVVIAIALFAVHGVWFCMNYSVCPKELHHDCNNTVHKNATVGHSKGKPQIEKRTKAYTSIGFCIYLVLLAPSMAAIATSQSLRKWRAVKLPFDRVPPKPGQVVRVSLAR